MKANLTINTSPALAVDSVGNIVITQFISGTMSSVTKFDAQLNQLWQVIDNAFDEKAVAVDSANNIFVGGDIHTTATNKDAGVKKYLPDGTPSWVGSVGSAQANDTVTKLAVGAEGTVVALGWSPGQLPGQPAAASGQGFELVFSSAGLLTRTTQSAQIGISLQELQVDSLGNSYVQNTGKLDPTGAILWPTTGDVHIAVGPSAVSFFAIEAWSAALGGLTLVRRDPSNGAATWARSFGTQKVTLNAAEGALWNGMFGGTTAMVASDSAVYVAGQYFNSYVNGSSPPPNIKPGFVAGFDLQGQQMWFRLYRIAPQATLPNNIVDSYPRAIALGAQGQLVVLGASNEVFTLKASDGSGP